MFTDIEAVIFDMDGTLIDSMWVWGEIDEAYLSKRGIEVPEDIQQCIEGMSFSETATYFKERFNLDDDVQTIKDEWNGMARDYYASKVTIKEGVYHFINILKKNNIKLGIATSNHRELVDLTVDRFNITEFFDSIRTSCEVERGKPHPDIYLQVAKDIGVKPENCLVFEDVPNGIIAGKSAGMKVCGIYDEFSKHVVDKMGELSDFYIYTYNEIIEKIEANHYEQIPAN